MSMTLQEKIDVMSAYQRGQGIQFSPCNRVCDWDDVYTPSWNFADYDYRIAPTKPREGYVHVASIRSSRVYDGFGYSNPDYVRVREIVDTGDRSTPPGGSISPQRNY